MGHLQILLSLSSTESTFFFFLFFLFFYPNQFDKTMESEGDFNMIKEELENIATGLRKLVSSADSSADSSAVGNSGVRRKVAEKEEKEEEKEYREVGEEKDVDQL